jgi:hypothetical protein
MTGEEHGDLIRFGDIVFLDGTEVWNPLRWTIYPITLVDDEKAIIAGGLLLTAYEHGEMFDWLLLMLNQIIGPVLRTVFTDEDSAIVPAMANLCCSTRPDVAHRVCVFHQQTTFTKPVNAARATAATRNQAVDLFHAICYAEEQEQMRAAIEKIRHLLSPMSDYLDREITEKFRSSVKLSEATPLRLASARRRSRRVQTV